MHRRRCEFVGEKVAEKNPLTPLKNKEIRVFFATKITQEREAEMQYEFWFTSGISENKGFLFFL